MTVLNPFGEISSTGEMKLPARYIALALSHSVGGGLTMSHSVGGALALSLSVGGARSVPLLICS